jgi:hypothetical protein
MGNRKGTLGRDRSAPLRSVGIGLAVLLAVLGPAPADAHPLTGSFTSTCSIDVNRSRIILTMLVKNTTEQSVLNLEPSGLGGSGVGDVFVFFQTHPRALRELLPGKTATFRWQGEVSGTGYLDLSGSSAGTYEDGDPALTGVVNCPRLTLGNPADLTPPPTNTPPNNTQVPTNTAVVQPTNTPRPQQPTRIVIPTNTTRPTRTRLPTRTPRPTSPPNVPTHTRTRTRTATPRDTPTPRNTPTVYVPPATRTPLPTRTPRQIVPTRTRVPTRTPMQLRPTRTPVPTRTPRGSNIVPTVPRPGGPPPGPVIQGLSATCSLRQTNDQISITMIVTNTTGVLLENIAASSMGLAPEGGALFFDPTGPSPRVHRVVAPGSAVEFQWGGRVNPVGAMGFSASVSATGPNNEQLATGVVNCGIAVGPQGFFDESTFTGSCSVRPGENGEISVRINNRSNETLSGVEAHFLTSSGSGTAQVNDLRGPAPRRVNRLAGGRSQTFIWQARIIGDGRVSVTFRANGTRPSGDRISTEVIMCDAALVATGPLPDLSVDVEDQRASWIVDQQFFAPDHCAVFEGCVAAPGNRTLLKFNTTTPNHGPGDLFLGDPRNNPEMIYSECHQHYHFEDYADYRLFDMQGNLVARGHKQAFCLVDLWRPPDSTGPRLPNFPDCGFQGISAGWADVYDRDLDCQWIDVTGVPNGRYILEVHVNPARVLRETNYANNVARTEVCLGMPRSECQ